MSEINATVEVASQVAPVPLPARPKRLRGRPPKRQPHELAPDDWTDHSDHPYQMMAAEIPWALESMFGVPRGLTAKAFTKLAQETISRHYPKFRKSSFHDLLDGNSGVGPFFVHVPDWIESKFRRAIRLCDLVETMIHDGHVATSDSRLSGHGPASDVQGEPSTTGKPD